ncbi:MAG: flavodoxin-dependent (E)-4-hydroxy-3-methylbut-2-enyl-diphosphate synthase [Eubacterium sp.]|jgi:(E)-4-hydroxy-3-methylbut-2-enyl-diphosphate synthase|nr:flavodoxin-dependent (E)-4-hydroxy-3-methylbut-2-enyl-diphosphate synthase [Eubacterium sp.]
MSKKIVKIRNIALGNEKVYIQSMLNLPSGDIEGNVNQAKRLEAVGCEIIRVSIPDIADVKLIPAIKNSVSMPVVADIHFDYRIALESVKAGADKIRINPGNIGDKDRVKAIVEACKTVGIPIRIGVNCGSVEKDLLLKHGGPNANALAEGALRQISFLNDLGFDDIVVSVKASDVKTNIAANRILSAETPYPIHIGVTEAGTERMGLIKSAVGIGSLLCDGIGDTIRVSLTADPEREIYAAKDILKAAGILKSGAEIISCPTCGRTKIDVVKLASQVEDALKDIEKSIKIAVMGCAVNGPGEAREADYGIAGGEGEGIIFKKGKVIKKVPEKKVLFELMNLVDKD